MTEWRSSLILIQCPMVNHLKILTSIFTEWQCRHKKPNGLLLICLIQVLIKVMTDTVKQKTFSYKEMVHSLNYYYTLHSFTLSSMVSIHFPTAFQDNVKYLNKLFFCSFSMSFPFTLFIFTRPQVALFCILFPFF